jgi:carbamoyltransferase
MVVLAIHSFTHDSSAALAVDGRLLAFGEEERFTRMKGDSGFPSRAIQYCLREAALKPSGVQRVGIPFRPGRGAVRRLRYLARRPSGFPGRARDLIRKGLNLRRVPACLAEMGIHCPVHYEDHYLCHAGAVFLSSPFERATVLVLDGVAEDACGALFAASRFPKPSIRCLRRFPFPDHSLGLLYAAITEHLGFLHNREEGKVMSMAAHGDESVLPSLGGIACEDSTNVVRLMRRYFDFAGSWTTPAFRSRFGPPRPSGEPFRPEHLCSECEVQQEQTTDLLRSSPIGRGNREGTAVPSSPLSVHQAFPEGLR